MVVGGLVWVLGCVAVVWLVTSMVRLVCGRGMVWLVCGSGRLVWGAYFGGMGLWNWELARLVVVLVPPPSREWVLVKLVWLVRLVWVEVVVVEKVKLVWWVKLVVSRLGVCWRMLRLWVKMEG